MSSFKSPALELCLQHGGATGDIVDQAPTLLLEAQLASCDLSIARRNPNMTETVQLDRSLTNLDFMPVLWQSSGYRSSTCCAL
eukprot:4992308-Amphidinium_carterae.1